MQVLAINKIGKSKKVMYQGSPHFVVPMTMIVPGVLNGSKGPIFYSKEEIKKDPTVWNGVPVVLYHPKKNNQPISARDPEVLNSVGIGIVLNAKTTRDGKLVADAYLSISALERVAPEVLNSIETNKAVEISTGLGMRMEDNEGEFNGITYNATAHDFQPDHLAVLPDQVGACSIEDGCGMLVNEMNPFQLQLVIQDALATNSSADSPYSVVTDVFEDHFIYKVENKLFKRNFSKTETDIVLDGEPVEVERQFAIIDNHKDDTMKFSDAQRKEHVDFIVANCSCWEESDREVLNGFEDAKLKKVKAGVEKNVETEAVANAAREGFEDQQGTSHVFNSESGKWESKAKEQSKETVTNDAPQTTEEWMSSAPADVQSVVRNAMKLQEEQKQDAIKTILANESNTFSKEALASMELETLQGIAAVAKVENKKQPVANYRGAAVGHDTVVNDDDDDDVLPIPTINWGENKN